jgi:hypothetical protein
MADGGGADYARVYGAVAADESDEDVRCVIAECAQGDGQRRAAAANWAVGKETPLKAAHRQRRGDLVLTAGARASSGLFNSDGH